MSNKQELKLLETREKTNHEKIIEAYRRIAEKLDKLIAKRNKKARTGT